MDGIEAVASTGDPAFALERGGQILAWNGAAEYCFGYRCSEVIGRRCWEVLRGRDLFGNRYCGETCSVRDMALRGEPVHRTHVVVRSASGEEVRLSMSTVVVRGKVDREIVHLCQCLPGCAEDTASAPWVPPTASHTALSPRQHEVLKHLADGKGTEELAELLCISPATARHHIQHILTRLKVHNRLQAVVLARRIGLL